MRALREEAIAYVARRRRAGATRRAIAAELGASDATVRRYLRAATPASPASPATTRRLREVAVVAPPAPAALVLVAPSGHRVEGLDVDAAIALLRGLA